MQQTWDERYNTPEYIYGTEPNQFFKYFIDSHIPGTLFFRERVKGEMPYMQRRTGGQLMRLTRAGTPGIRHLHWQNRKG